MSFFKQLGMAAATRSASGSVNAKWMPGLLSSTPTGFGSGSGVVGIGGYHTATEVGRYWTRYSVLKKVFEANLKGGVVHECSYHPLKRGINVVPCFEIPKTEKEEEKELREKELRLSYLATSAAVKALLPPIPHKLSSKVQRANFVRFNKKGAVLHAYQFSWREGVKLTPILNSGRTDLLFESNRFLFTFKITAVVYPCCCCMFFSSSS